MAETTMERTAVGRGAAVTEWTPPRGRKRWQLEDGEAMVAALRASGETQGAFAERHGLQEVRVQRWVARVAGRSPKRVVKAPPGKPSPAVEFARVRVMAPAVRSGELEVIVGGAVVRVGRDMEDELLRRVVAALVGAGC